MPFPIRITVVDERPPDVTIRAWRELMRDAHREMGERWHQTMLPRHFQPGAREKYGYQARTRKYAVRKNRDFARGKAVAGGNVDLVYTGLLRQTMTSVASVRAFPSRVTVAMAGPRYITMRPKSNQPDKAAEVTKLTQAEEQELSELLNERVTAGLNALRAPTTTTIG